jgi:hypothetical protein
MKKELLLAAMGISSLTPGCVPSGTEDPMPPDSLPTGQVASKKIDVDRLLKRVAEQPIPESLNPGAMCYAMVAAAKLRMWQMVPQKRSTLFSEALRLEHIK